VIQLISIAVLLAQLLAPVARPKPADGNPRIPPIPFHLESSGAKVIVSVRTFETKKTAAGFSSRGIPPHAFSARCNPLAESYQRARHHGVHVTSKTRESGFLSHKIYDFRTDARVQAKRGQGLCHI